MQLLRQQHLPQIINMNDTDDAKSQLPNFMQENPFDTRVARRMKRAYSSLDAAGVRMGILLRRYPLMRTLVIIYVTFLHLWVMFVLCSSTPTWTSKSLEKNRNCQQKRRFFNKKTKKNGNFSIIYSTVIINYINFLFNYSYNLFVFITFPIKSNLPNNSDI